MTNTQGDILGIYNSSGNKVAGYEYDEWGKICSTYLIEEEYADISQINPIRYRGYYYDTETGYYYLQSRYYDPSICRFINADDYNYLDKDIETGLNLFAYCCNDPVNNSDPFGMAVGVLSASAIGAILLALPYL